MRAQSAERDLPKDTGNFAALIGSCSPRTRTAGRECQAFWKGVKIPASSVQPFSSFEEVALAEKIVFSSSRAGGERLAGCSTRNSFLIRGSYRLISLVSAGPRIGTKWCSTKTCPGTAHVAHQALLVRAIGQSVRPCCCSGMGDGEDLVALPPFFPLPSLAGVRLVTPVGFFGVVGRE